MKATLQDLKTLEALYSKFSTPLENIPLGTEPRVELICDDQYRIICMSGAGKIEFIGEKRDGLGYKQIISSDYLETGMEDLNSLRDIFDEFGRTLNAKYEEALKESKDKTLLVFDDESLQLIYKSMLDVNSWAFISCKSLENMTEITKEISGIIFSLSSSDDKVKFKIQKGESRFIIESDGDKRRIEKCVSNLMQEALCEIDEELQARSLSRPTRPEEKTRGRPKNIKKKSVIDPVKPVVNPVTKSIRLNQGKIRFDLIPPEFVRSVAEVFTFGANKYSDHNWKGFTSEQQEEIKGSLLRHIYAYLEGEENDPESGLSHLAHAGCNLAFMIYFKNKGDLKC